MDEPRVRPPDEPPGKGQQRHTHDSWHENGRNPISQTLNRRAGPFGVRHHLDDLGQHGIRADLGRLHRDCAGLVDRPARDGVALGLFDRQRFSGDHAFVKGRMAVRDLAIDRHRFPRPHAQQVACHDVFQRGVVFVAVRRDAPGGFRCQIKQGADRVTGAFAGAQFQHLTDKDQGDDDDRRLEIGADPAIRAIDRGKHPRQEGGEQRIGIGGPDAKRDEGPHVRAAVDDRIPAALEEWQCRPQHDWGRQQKFQISRDLMPQPVADRQADHTAHRQHDQRHRCRDRDPEPAGEIHQLVRRFIRGRHRFQRHAAQRAGPRRIADDFGVHRAGILRAGDDDLGFVRSPATGIKPRIALELCLAFVRAEMERLVLIRL